MRKHMPEFLALPLVAVLLGVIVLVLWAASAGVGVWLAVGALLLAALVVGAVVAARRPRARRAAEAEFEGGAAAVADDVHRVLLVVDGSCTTRDLEAVPDGRDETSVFVVAPAVSSRLDRWTGDEQAYESADEHLASALQALGELGYEARGHVGPHDPLQASDDGLREFPADEIVFALSGERGAKWLEEGVVDLAAARYSLPVRRLAAGAAGDR